MRLLLGGLLLIAVFAAAALWHRSWTDSARSRRDQARVSGTTTDDGLEQGWSRVVVGRPSGSPAFEPIPRNTPAHGGGITEPALAQESRRVPPLLPASPPTAAEVTVREGQSLSRICEQHYGTASWEVVEAVVRHNRLLDADSLRAGQKLALPALDSIVGRR